MTFSLPRRPTAQPLGWPPPLALAIGAGYPGGEAGFTLLEAVLVVMIVGAVAMVVVPPFASYQDEEKVIGAASELASCLRFAASEANRSKRPLRLELTPANETYALRDDTTAVLMVNPIDKRPFAESWLPPSPYAGVDLATVNGNTTVTTVLFNGRGTVATDTTIVLQYAGHRRDIVIKSATGRIVVH